MSKDKDSKLIYEAYGEFKEAYDTISSPSDNYVGPRSGEETDRDYMKETIDELRPMMYKIEKYINSRDPGKHKDIRIYKALIRLKNDLREQSEEFYEFQKMFDGFDIPKPKAFNPDGPRSNSDRASKLDL